jgi:competence protein ComEA
MRRNAGALLLVLAIATFAGALIDHSYAFAASDREEVKQRLELNNTTAEELAATGAVDLELAKKIIQLRDDLGGFQSYDDLKELNIPTDKMEKLFFNTTIKGIASDCTC